MWRYARHRGRRPSRGEPAADDGDRLEPLWDAVGASRCRCMLVRGMRPQSVVDDDDEAELLRRQPAARVEHVAEAGHSVQGDTPVELAELIQRFIRLIRGSDSPQPVRRIAL